MRRKEHPFVAKSSIWYARESSEHQMTKDEWYKQLFEHLGNSKFRSSFHLGQKEIDYIPVSYTHLDVYKRQEQYIVETLAKYKKDNYIPTVSFSGGKDSSVVSRLVMDALQDNAVTVSYTHIDMQIMRK